MSINIECSSELLEQIHATLSRGLERDGLTREQADVLARSLVADMVEQFGGSQLYLPSAKRYKAALRNAAIVKDSATLSVDQLVRKYKVSMVTIWGVLGKAGLSDS